jgi:hypothetical protein
MEHPAGWEQLPRATRIRLLRLMLSDHDADLLDEVCTHPEVDGEVIAEELVAASARALGAAIPPVPADLEPFYDPTGAEYGATLNLALHDIDAAVAVRQRLITEAADARARGERRRSATRSALEELADRIRSRRTVTRYRPRHRSYEV